MTEFSDSTLTLEQIRANVAAARALSEAQAAVEATQRPPRRSQPTRTGRRLSAATRKAISESKRAKIARKAEAAGDVGSLRAARHAAALTQEAAARRAGVSRRIWWQAENGKPVSRESARRIKLAFGIEVAR